MKAYAPPYEITTTILNLVAEITESLGRIESDSIPLQLRKINNVRSIHSSLAIENNTLSLEQVSRIIEGKTVPALKREIDEVKNAAACYELISKLNPHDEKDLFACPFNNDEWPCKNGWQIPHKRSRNIQR